jgi:hypothetical protein
LKTFTPDIKNILRLISRTTFVILVVLLCNTENVFATSRLTLADPTTAVSATSICASSTKVPIYAFNISADGSSGSGSLTNFKFHPSGSYLASEIVEPRLCIRKKIRG